MLFRGNLLNGIQPSTITIQPQVQPQILGRAAQDSGGSSTPSIQTIFQRAATPGLPQTAYLPPSAPMVFPAPVKEPPSSLPPTDTPMDTPTDTPSDEVLLPTAPLTPDASAVTAPSKTRQWVILGLVAATAATGAYLLSRRR